MRGLKFLWGCSICSLAVVATQAPAQTVPASEPLPAEAEASQGESGAEIIVTGSRIARRDLVSESPIVTIGQAEIKSAGSATLESSLTQLPQISTSAGASSSYRGRGGQASADLRGLGQQRTLVLIDGRRIQPANPDGSIDLNLIPPSLVESVETITGGASATYGSDAVTGVINIKLRKKVRGVELYGQNTISTRGDSAVRQIGAVAGTGFADDRGQVFVSVDFSDRDPTRFIARDYLANQGLSNRLPHGVVEVNASNLPLQSAVNTIFTRYGVAPGGASRSARFAVNSDNTLFTQNGAVNFRDLGRTTETVFNNSVYNSVGNVFVLQTEMKRYNATAHVDYDIGNEMRAYAQVLFNDYTVALPQTNLVFGAAGTQAVQVSVANPFIPTDLAQLLASRPNPGANFAISRGLPELGVVIERNHYTTVQALAGLGGSIGSRGWRWDLYGTRGSTRQRTLNENYISLSGINRILQSSTGGTEYCAGGYNPFSLQPMSLACQAYLRRDPRTETVLKQTVVEGVVNGQLASLPAGDLSIAIGADYRRNSYSFEVDSAITANDIAYFLPVAGSHGATSVVEAFGEALIPLFSDVPLMRKVSIDLAYRFSKYNISGTTHTYKASIDWEVVPELRFRGGYSRAVRAPSAGELFSGAINSSSALGTIGLVGAGDPCDVRSAYRAASATGAAQVAALCQAQGVPQQIVGTFTNLAGTTPYRQVGNEALKPEIADTFTAGVVLQASGSHPLLSRLGVSIDAYYIKLRGAVGYVTSVTALQKCFNADGSNPSYASANYFCSLITRNAGSGQLDLVENPLLNLGGYKTFGIDVAANWGIDLDALGLGRNAGNLTLSSTVNYLNSFKIQTLPGGPFLDYAGTLGNTQIDPFATAHPRWKATTSIRHDMGGLGTSLKWRYLGPMNNASNVGTNGNAAKIHAISYFDALLDIKIGDRFGINAGIINFTDVKPPRVNSSPIGVIYTDIPTYDLVGRRAFFGVNAKF